MKLARLPPELLHLILAEVDVGSSVSLALTSQYFWHSIALEPVSRDLSFAWLCFKSFHRNKNASRIKENIEEEKGEEDTKNNVSLFFGNGLGEDAFVVNGYRYKNILPRGYDKAGFIPLSSSFFSSFQFLFPPSLTSRTYLYQTEQSPAPIDCKRQKCSTRIFARERRCP